MTTHMKTQVNGWEMHYMEKSFLHQCKERFGVDTGEHVWEECNQAFDRLPLAAVIDHEIFCIHGGFPRPIHIEGDGDEGETQLLVSVQQIFVIVWLFWHGNCFHCCR